MGRVLALVAAALAVAIGGLLLAVFLTRDEHNVSLDNLLSERFSKAVATQRTVDLRQVAPFEWDRVLIVAQGTPRAAISRRLGREWTGIVGIRAGDLLIFLRGRDVVRFADYRGEGRFAGIDRPFAEIPRERAVFEVDDLVIRPA